MSNNSRAWNHTNVVDYFNKNRTSESGVYPSEWFFLKKLFKENMSVLDIGCAQGGFSGIIGERLNDFSYTGLDISKKMIDKAKLKHPEHTFFHINEDDYSVLGSEKCNAFDLTIVLGILHLHESWRDTIKNAWKHTSSTLILDLRETFEETIENKEKSYFKMNINGDNTNYSEFLPYNVINVRDALYTISSICNGAKKISHFGYTQEPSGTAVCPIEKIFATVYCIEK